MMQIDSIINEWHLGLGQGVASLLLLVVMPVLFYFRRRWSERGMSGRSSALQVMGTLLKSKASLALSLCLLALIVLFSGHIAHRIDIHVYSSPHNMAVKALVILFALLLLVLTARVVTNLNQIYSLRKLETRITWSQVVLLLVFGLSILLAVFALGIKKDDDSFIFISTAGVILGWIFQDTIKSVAAFFYLRANGLLQIGDLITVSSKGIEGFVRCISLTTVTIENWDTTTSAFPTYILHAEHFKNSQRMMEGKTLGRLMKRTFVFDTSWIHPLSQQDAEHLHEVLDLDSYASGEVAKPGMLNIEAFRLYIYHWLMANPHVSQQPRLIVRWLEQTGEGMPLQLFVYLTDTMLDAFEWQQSLITEHVIKAMGWFGLQLYQKPSGYDTSNNNIFLTKEAADYHKTDKHHVRNK